MPMIEVSNLTKYFGEAANRVAVLNEVNLSIESGEFIAIIGQSGSGKTTLMNTLGCLDTPSSGSYKIDGREVSSLSSNELAKIRGEKFGFIFQRYNLLSSLSALDNVALPAIYLGIGHAQRVSRAKKLLTDLGLGDKLKNKPHELSGGQQQRVSIARALMNGGQIILADEPTGALDSQSGKMVMQVLTELHRLNHTIILVTHDPQIAKYAHRVIEIKDGNIISDIRKHPLEENNVKEKPAKRKYNSFIFYKDQLVESFKMSIQAILAHKLRSILTMLGIIIGIASVVSVVALGRGSQEKILADISSLGTDTITIYPGSGAGDIYSGKVTSLSVDDAQELAKLNYLGGVSPTASASGVLVFNNVSVNAQVAGVNEQYANIKGLKIATGRFFNKEDVINNNAVVVIDNNTKKRLFPSSNAIGKVVLFNKQPLEIIGVTAPSSGFMAGSNNLELWIPYTTVMTRVSGNQNITSIIVKVKESLSAQIADQGLKKFLAVKHGTEDFYTASMDSIKQTIQSTTNTMTLLISCIALISLVVGGIGVMNIMLVSVTERTKEIGVRMAIGAREYSILEQFLIEAVLICLIGGGLGIGLSYLIGFIFSYLLEGFPFLFSLDSIIVALCCSSVIGIVFGFMPARNASRLNPIVALSRE
ncbi:MacB family efflux pump subunit [Entomomonas moraniae]|uniref:Pyoverdine export ATP-binding/permease protein PvdT n=1 Tax=Entomomonas moraniae TaxID=2213226 RepID=A0A3Q9JHH1_9GAMM|nr:MacB family efflux pump subunit [Entomomonas moraniae]AZS49713.1 MacB family efflux pump subunit [Entomomonas moraniae]